MIFYQSKPFRYVMLAVILLGFFGAGFWVGEQQIVCNVCAPEAVNFSLFWDAYNKLHQHFITPNKIDDQKILYGAITGMTKSLGDPYTDFFDPVQAKMFQESLEGLFDGIGVEVGMLKNQLTVIAPLKGTPAAIVGLKSGDQIIKINGESTADMSIDDAIRIIRGKKGTEVILTIFRDDWKQTKDITIIRNTIKVDSVTWELKNNEVAYISIRQFDEPLSADFKKAAFEILKSPAKKIILDLRDNPGGYLGVAQDIAGWFLKSGQLVTIEDFGKDKKQQEYRTDGNSALMNYPMVVLMNKGSASASEILAGTLRDNRGVTLIGEKSFGKGSVQEAINLQDGKSFLKITIAKWLTPKGNSISEVGLKPDVAVQMTVDDFTAKRDPQLAKALEILDSLK